MDKNVIKSFFDSLAPTWDLSLETNDEVIREILTKGGVAKGKEVLDVACGTGVLFPYYKEVGASFTGVDLSPEMVKIAKSKYPEAEVICADADSFDFDRSFDVIMIHNAYPHFPDGERLISNLSRFLKRGGRLTVAHSMSASELEKCHSGAAGGVSLPLPGTQELVRLMSKWLTVDFSLSDDKMYIVSGVNIV